MPESALEPVVDQTLVASLPDRGAKGAAAATSSSAPAAPAGVSEIKAALSVESWRQKEAKLLARSHGGGASAISAERKALWKGIYAKREGGEEAVNANTALYWETVKTCFGNTKGEVLYSVSH